MALQAIPIIILCFSVQLSREITMCIWAMRKLPGQGRCYPHSQQMGQAGHPGRAQAEAKDVLLMSVAGYLLPELCL